MKNMWIIAKKDLGSFFSSPVFYSLTSVFLILNGFIFFNILNFFSLRSFQGEDRPALVGPVLLAWINEQLGVNGVVIVSHGKSSPKAVKNSLLAAKKCITENLLGDIQHAITEHMVVVN